MREQTETISPIEAKASLQSSMRHSTAKMRQTAPSKAYKLSIWQVSLQCARRNTSRSKHDESCNAIHRRIGKGAVPLWRAQVDKQLEDLKAAQKIFANQLINYMLQCFQESRGTWSTGGAAMPKPQVSDDGTPCWKRAQNGILHHLHKLMTLHRYDEMISTFWYQMLLTHIGKTHGSHSSST